MPKLIVYGVVNKYKCKWIPSNTQLSQVLSFIENNADSEHTDCRGWHDPYPHCLHRLVLEVPSERNDYFKGLFDRRHILL